MSTRRSKTRFRKILRGYCRHTGALKSNGVFLKYIRLQLKLSGRPPKYDTQDERHMKHLDRVIQSDDATGDIMKYEREHPRAFRRLAGDARD